MFSTLQREFSGLQGLSGLSSFVCMTMVSFWNRLHIMGFTILVFQPSSQRSNINFWDFRRQFSGLSQSTSKSWTNTLGLFKMSLYVFRTLREASGFWGKLDRDTYNIYHRALDRRTTQRTTLGPASPDRDSENWPQPGSRAEEIGVVAFHRKEYTKARQSRRDPTERTRGRIAVPQRGGSQKGDLEKQFLFKWLNNWLIVTFMLLFGRIPLWGTVNELTDGTCDHGHQIQHSRRTGFRFNISDFRSRIRPNQPHLRFRLPAVRSWTDFRLSVSDSDGMPSAGVATTSIFTLLYYYYYYYYYYCYYYYYYYYLLLLPISYQLGKQSTDRPHPARRSDGAPPSKRRIAVMPVSGLSVALTCSFVR